MCLTEEQESYNGENSAEIKRVIIDSDTYNEIDDQFAIVQAMLSPDKIKVEAILAAPFSNHRSTSPGNGMELSYDEIICLLDRLNISSKNLVWRGVTEYVGENKIAREAEAVERLIELARSASPVHPIYIIAIAAISNIASALLKAPDIADSIVIVWLASNALHWPDVWEFNLSQDIGAAQVVLDSRVRLVLVPCMGIVTHLRSTVPEIERYVEPHGKIGHFLACRFKEYNKEHIGWSKEIWDMAATSWLLHPEAMKSISISAPIINNDGSWTMTSDRHSIKYVWWLDRDIILRDFFIRLASR